MTWLYIGASRKFDAEAQQARDNQHAEQVALDYAVRAAIMDYKDLGPWKRALVAGTTPELSKKLTDAANAMEQILLPLEWSSSAKPIAAKVRSHDKGVYVVDAFVSVLTKTVQAAEKLQSTATYSVTIDPSNGWNISDVGGIGQVVGDR
jgi:Mce-associated membrane protein